MVSIDQVKALRDETSISIMECKKALEEARGDKEKALAILKSKGRGFALKKSGRTLGAGVIASYIHSDKRIGVLLELLCETDFVAKNEEFRNLADEIAMHIAAMAPEYVRDEDVSDEERGRMEALYKPEVEKMHKPESVKEKILRGKLDIYFDEKILLRQPFIREPEIRIRDLLERAIQKIGEKIEISRFSRYVLLEE